MNPAILLTLPILALCKDGIVTKYATEVVYICDPSNITSECFTACDIETSALSTDPQAPTSIAFNSSTIDPADPDPNHDGLVDVSIFNDREAGKIMAEYTWDCNYYNCSVFSDYLESQNGTISKRNDNHGEDAWKNIHDIEDEIGDTTKIDPDLDHAKGLLANHTYLGALSVYEDVARNLDLSSNKDYPELFYFKNIWEIMWALFKEHNDKKHAKDIQKSRDAAGILLLMVPNNYMIQTKEYENVRTYVNQRFNRSDHEPANAQPPDKFKIVDTLKKDHPLNEDETNFVRKLASDHDASQSYVLHMLNIYYQYGKTNGVDASDDARDKRIVYGWGAMKKETDAGSSHAIADTAKGWASLFGLGIPLAAVYAVLADTAAVPLTVEQIENSVKDKTYSTIRETTTASSISSTSSTSSTTSTSATCEATYQTELEDDDWFSVVQASLDAETTTIDLNKRALPTATAPSDASPHIVARGDTEGFTVKTPKLEDYCQGAGDDDKIKTCKAVLERHTVEFDPKTWSYKNIPNNLGSDSFYMYGGFGKKTAYKSSNQLPIYVVNALGQSPGVACNALKYIATSSLVTPEFSGFKSDDDAKNLKNGMLTLVRGSAYSRAQVKRSRRCRKPDKYSDNDWIKIDPGKNSKGKSGGYSGKTMQLDEFPPLSANLVVGHVENVAVTCVPDHDNSRDGTSLGRFYTASGPKGNVADFWNNKCPKLTPAISNYTDFAYYMPTIKDSGKRSPLTAVSPKDYDSFLDDTLGGHGHIGDNKAFIVVVNTKDTEGKDIQCSRYTNGNEFVFRTY